MGGGMVLITEEEAAEQAAKELLEHPPESVEQFESWARQLDISAEQKFDEYVKLFGAEKRRTAWSVFFGKLDQKFTAAQRAPQLPGQKNLHSDVTWEKIDPKHRTSFML